MMNDPLAPEPAPQREPVKQLALLGSLLSAAIVAVGGAVALIVAHSDLSAIAQAVGGAVVAVGTLAAFLAPYLAALRARKLVTPLSDPRAADGTPLIREQLRPPGPQRPGVADHAAG